MPIASIVSDLWRGAFEAPPPGPGTPKKSRPNRVKHGIYISKNTALQKSREILIKILKLNLSIYKFIKYMKYNTQ